MENNMKTEKEILYLIKTKLTWYRSCAGQISRDDMDAALRSILILVREWENQNPYPGTVVDKKLTFNEDF